MLFHGKNWGFGGCASKVDQAWQEFPCGALLDHLPHWRPRSRWKLSMADLDWKHESWCPACELRSYLVVDWCYAVIGPVLLHPAK